MSKRAKFVFCSFILSLGFVAINFLDDRFRFISIGGLTLTTLVLFFWALREGISKNATLLTLVLPTLFTLGVGLFWFLLPTHILARLPVVILYGIGLYALSLTSNIFTVSTIRTIALARAARGVGFILTLLTSFFLFDAILSLKTEIYIVSILTFLACFPLFLQGLWVSLLEKNLNSHVIRYAVVLSLAVTQLAILLFFWPVSVVVGSLFLTVSIYVLLGLGQAQLEERLFVRTLREYVSVGFIVFVAVLLATHWGN